MKGRYHYTQEIAYTVTVENRTFKGEEVFPREKGHAFLNFRG